MSAVRMYRASCGSCSSRLIVSEPERPESLRAPAITLPERGISILEQLRRLPKRRAERHLTGQFRSRCPICDASVLFTLQAIANREEVGKWLS